MLRCIMELQIPTVACAQQLLTKNTTAMYRPFRLCRSDRDNATVTKCKFGSRRKRATVRRVELSTKLGGFDE